MSNHYQKDFIERKRPPKQINKKNEKIKEALQELWDKGDLEDLGKLCDSILKRNKKNVHAIGYKGAFLLESGHYPLASKYFQAGLKLDKKNLFILKNKVRLHKIHKDDEEELKTLDQILEIHQDLESLFRKGDILENQNKFEEALECFEKALEVSPKERVILERRANLLEMFGRHLELLDFYDAELANQPNNIVLLRLKGRTLKKIGKFNEAIECFDQIKNSVWRACYKGETFQEIDNYIDAMNCFNKALGTDQSNLFARVKKLRLSLELKGFENFKEEIEILKNTLKDELEEQESQSNLEEGETAPEKDQSSLHEVAISILETCQELVTKIDEVDPLENIYNLLKRTEEMDFLKENIDQLSLCLDVNLEYSQKNFSVSIGKMQLEKSSCSITFKTKQILSTVDKEVKIEQYKHTLVKCFLRLFKTIKCATLSRFCEERGFSEVELEYVYLPWRNVEYDERLVRNFFEWNNFRHYIDKIHWKYHNFFTENLFIDISNLVMQINKNMPFRARIRKARNNPLVVQFKEMEMKENILHMFKDHSIKYIQSDEDFLAYVDFEVTKEILLKSSFPKKFQHMIKLRNIFYYLLHPKVISNRGGVIILRNPDDMGKDTEEIKMLLRKEVLIINGLTYSSDKIQNNKNQVNDLLDVTLDLFIWQPIRMKFRGFSSEKKVKFQIPAYNYNFMVNIKILQSNFHLNRKVIFDCKSLHKKKTNFSDVLKEVQTRDMRRALYSSFTEKCGDFGIFLL